MKSAADLLQAALQNPPFPWQVRLLNRFLEGKIPDALDLPTGLGKTSVMAIWLVARACGAPLPRRLVYIVDRRAVVDQATQVAEDLRVWVAASGLAERLGLGTRHLPISTLRGQHVDNREWLEDPSATAIVVGTVDMVGSRLLFEGYGSSRRMRPYFAGMLGHDTLFVLDEAHLVPPFEHLVRQVVAYPRTEAATALPQPRLLPLSATGRSYLEPFQLDADDTAHPIVRQRVEAPKWITLHSLEGKLPQALAQRAWDLAGVSDTPRQVLVFTSRRDDAEATRRALEKLARADRPRGAKVPPVVLFVGGRRVAERQLAHTELLRAGFLAGSEPPDDHAFVIATSAGEVGVDLDADDLVCDVVPWERMVQRLGRVNRRGSGTAGVHVFYDPEDDAAAPVLQLLRALPEGGQGRSASPGDLGRLRGAFPEEVEAATTREPHYPPLAHAVVQAWSLTSLEVHPGRPEVQPWLRGWTEDPPQSTLLWRRLLPPADTPPAQVAAFFAAAPPHAIEKLELPTHQIGDWLAKRVRRLANREDLPSGVLLYLLDAGRGTTTSWTLQDLQRELAGRGKARFLARLGGTTLVADSLLAGLAESGLLDDKQEEPPCDVLVAPADSDPIVPFRVALVERERPGTPGWYEVFRLAVAGPPDEPSAWLVVDKWRSTSTTEDTRSASRPQSLVEHQAWALDQATRICAALQIPTHLSRLICIAARLHDEGKQAARWQRAFSAPTDDQAPYAKTRGPVNVHLLDGYRHELGSLPFAERDPEVAALDPDDRDLVLHLIAAHHGHARPTLTPRGCDDAPPSVVEKRVRAVAKRFVALQHRWGPWGLVYLETLLRAADQSASRRNDEERR